MNIRTLDYSTFKALTKQLTSKGNVWWFLDGGGTFSAVSLAKDLSYILNLVGVTGKPGSFDTDFPGATEGTRPIEFGGSPFYIQV